MTTTPETREELQALVGPGQQDVFDQFLEEIEQQQADIDAAEQQQEEPENKLLAGKFKSTEDLEKAYLEAQKLISQRGQKAAEPEAPTPLSREQAAEHYGDAPYDPEAYVRGRVFALIDYVARLQAR